MKKKYEKFHIDPDFKTYSSHHIQKTMSFWPACFGRSGPIKKFWFECQCFQKLKPVL